MIKFRKYNKKRLPLAVGIEQTSCCTILGLMSKQIYLVYILPLMATTDMCVILCILMNHKCTKEDIDGIDVDENGPPEHIWDNIELSEYYFRLKDALVGILFHHPYIPLHYIWFKVKGVIPATTNWLNLFHLFF